MKQIKKLYPEGMLVSQKMSGSGKLISHLCLLFIRYNISNSNILDNNMETCYNIKKQKSLHEKKIIPNPNDWFKMYNID